MSLYAITHFYNVCMRDNTDNNIPQVATTARELDGKRDHLG